MKIFRSQTVSRLFPRACDCLRHVASHTLTENFLKKTVKYSEKTLCEEKEQKAPVSTSQITVSKNLQNIWCFATQTKEELVAPSLKTPKSNKGTSKIETTLSNPTSIRAASSGGSTKISSTVLPADSVSALHLIVVDKHTTRLFKKMDKSKVKPRTERSYPLLLMGVQKSSKKASTKVEIKTSAN